MQWHCWVAWQKDSWLTRQLCHNILYMKAKIETWVMALSPLC